MTLQTVGNVQSELEDKKAYLQNLINLPRVGIIIVGACEDRIRDLNCRTLQTCGKSREEIVEQLCRGVICPAEVGRCPITHTGNKVAFSSALYRPTNKSQSIYSRPRFRCAGKARPVLVESRWEELLWVKCERPDQEATLTLEFQLRACETVGAVQPV